MDSPDQRRLKEEITGLRAEMIARAAEIVRRQGEHGAESQRLQATIADLRAQVDGFGDVTRELAMVRAQRDRFGSELLALRTGGSSSEDGGPAALAALQQADDLSGKSILEDKISALERQLADGAKARYVELRTERERHTTELRPLLAAAARTARLEADLANMSKQLEEGLQKIRDFEASTSWRLTAPLRALKIMAMKMSKRN